MHSIFQFIQRIAAAIWHRLKKTLQFISLCISTLVLLAPAMLFLLATWFCFWNLPQGKDVLLAMLERKWVGGIVLLSVLFSGMVNWYSSRILLNRKKLIIEGIEAIAFQLPRIIGFSSFSIIWIALLRLPKDAYLHVHVGKGYDWLLLLISLIIYFVLDKIFSFVRDKKLKIARDEEQDDLALLRSKDLHEKNKFDRIFLMMGIALLLLIVLNTLIQQAWLLFVSVLLLQCLFLFMVVIRRGRIPLQKENEMFLDIPQNYPSAIEWQQATHAAGADVHVGLWELLLYHCNIQKKEKVFFIAYNILSALLLCIYLLAIFNYGFSVILGSFACLLIAFGVMVGFFSMVSMASIISKVNIHVMLWILAFIIGSLVELHWTNLIHSSDPKQLVFSKRPSLLSYFDQWTTNRKIDIEKDSTYPVFFVLADGGASRSGYWTAGVLSELEDSTRGQFSEHLICLSGASGGSVGNGSFLALLKYRDALKATGKTYTQGATEFLQSDFLTYTLARTLGPDIVRPIIPLPFIDDRATALEQAIEKGENSFLQKKFSTPLSEFIPFTNGNDKLPMICINSTRMQDGHPAVLSTVQLDAGVFGQRIDLLKDFTPGTDIKLSTSVVLGARFPYISPAGRIGNSYYVDGGYFDNSGAGVVNEMIIAFRNFISTERPQKPYLSKLRFYVIHAENGYNNFGSITKVNTVVNDLASPVLTLVGAFGTQTSVNDWRLEQYMRSLPEALPAEPGYYHVNLYSDKSEHEEYPMNWAISDYYIQKMNRQLQHNPELKNLFSWLHTRLSW
ncbi:MAG: patatin-like phospholipase family protein [Sphingobacteriales bacterium]|nr:patatin-like phospholipase family protein [Sphingobacteriales bacterium]